MHYGTIQKPVELLVPVYAGLLKSRVCDRIFSLFQTEIRLIRT